jgi:hypothetical protein
MSIKNVNSSLMIASGCSIGQTFNGRQNRRGEPLKGPVPDPYKDWDGTAEPAGGQNDRAEKRRINREQADE